MGREGGRERERERTPAGQEQVVGGTAVTGGPRTPKPPFSSLSLRLLGKDDFLPSVPHHPSSVSLLRTQIHQSPALP